MSADNEINNNAATIKAVSRKSQLALIQTDDVIAQLKKLHPDKIFEVVTMTTVGDKILDRALSKIGEKSLFTKELEVSLEEGRTQFAVHSLKDMPTSLPQGMVIGAVCKREDPYDAVVMHPKYENKTLASLPPDSKIGTSSLRRVAQLKRLCPHLKYMSVRGNLNTRLKKLDDGDTYSALILAKAGLKRMDLEYRISHTLSTKECMYAVGQGALAIECRANDFDTIKLVSALTDKETVMCCIAERAFMKALGGGCSVPVAVASEISTNKQELKLTGGVFSLDGAEFLIETKICSLPESDAQKDFYIEDLQNLKTYSGIIAPALPQDYLAKAEELGIDLAEQMIKQGAKNILDNARRQNEESSL